MINLPYNVPLVPQLAASQSAPMRTNHTAQTVPSATYPVNLQDPFKQGPIYQFQQQDVLSANHQYVPNVLPTSNPYQPIFQPSNVPPSTQTQPNYGPLPQNILDQIRGYVGNNAAPIFILPAGCHQSTNHHQQAPPLNQGGVPQSTGQSTGFNYPPSIYCPPSFYPYPIPLPVYETFAAQTRDKERPQSYGCCHRRQEYGGSKNCCCSIDVEEPHRCTAGNDDTICSKRNCPASISLQALASQFLSLQGIISCAATRLVLRKVPGSNITGTMEDTMDKALRSIGALTKDQLLAESRNAQQVNALINLHMTTNLPANIIPLLTLLQLKVNVLKAQVECLINKKVMECQGYGFQVETAGPIDPAVLTLKSNAELRQLLSALRQKECDERVNVNFSPYHSQRVIAESRLSNVQSKIRQVEAEFDRRRCVSTPAAAPTMTSRVIQQFSEARCTFDFAQTRLFEPYTPETVPESPDPFLTSVCSPRRLCLKPRTPTPEAPRQESSKGTSTCEDGTGGCKDTGTDAETKEKSVERRCSEDSCSCGGTSSEESVEDKKKLRLRIDRAGNVTIASMARLRNVSLMKLAPNVVAVIDTNGSSVEGRRLTLRTVKDSDPSCVQDTGDGRLEICDSPEIERKEDTLDRMEIKKEDFEDKLSKIKEEPDEAFDDKGLGTKENDLSHVDTSSQNQQLQSTEIKTEPESLESTDPSDRPIKKQEPSDVYGGKKRGLFRTTKYVKFGPKTAKPDPYPGPKEEARAKFVTEMKIDPKFDAKKQSPAPKNEPGSVENPNTTNTELDGPKGKFLTDSATTEESPTPVEEDVSKEQGTGSEVPAHVDNETSSGLFKSFAEFSMKPRKKRLLVAKKTDSTRTNETNAERDEPRGENGTGNVQIVSMVTGIKYDRRFDDYGRLMETNECVEERRGRNSVDFSRDLEEESVTDGNHARPGALSGKTDPSTVSANRRYETETVINTTWRTGVNTLFRETFARDRRPNDKIADHDRLLPSLKFLTPSARTGERNESHGIEIEPKSWSHREEIEPKAWSDRNTCYRAEPETSLVSAICSTIASHLVSFNSLLSNIPNFQTVLRNLHPGKSSGDKFSPTNRLTNEKRNKTLVARKGDWFVVPSNATVRDAPRYDCTGKVRQVRRSIIVDGGRKKYVLIGGTVSDRSRELSKNGFERPYHVRRSLLIRSRLKNSGNGKHECPFAVSKVKTGKIFASREHSGCREDLESKADENPSSSRKEDRFETLKTIVSCDVFIGRRRDNETTTVSENATSRNGDNACDAVNRSDVSMERIRKVHDRARE